MFFNLDFRTTNPITDCYINGHGPIHCGSPHCPFQPEFPINQTSIEDDIREKIEKLKQFCKIVFHGEINYNLKQIKSLIRKIIKKIKLMLGKDVIQVSALFYVIHFRALKTPFNSDIFKTQYRE